MDLHMNAANGGSEARAGRCPVCANKMVVQGEHELLVKNAILRVDCASGQVTAKCARCKAWVEVPLRYTGQPQR
jgi:DNA-directed RNA polymerase subunit RPC12/RpoP